MEIGYELRAKRASEESSKKIDGRNIIILTDLKLLRRESRVLLLLFLCFFFLTIKESGSKRVVSFLKNKSEKYETLKNDRKRAKVVSRQAKVACVTAAWQS